MKHLVIYALIVLLPAFAAAQTKKELSVNNRRAIENYNLALKSYDRYDYIEAQRLLRESIELSQNSLRLTLFFPKHSI